MAKKLTPIVQVATELNELLGLNPEIDVKLKTKELTAKIEEAAGLLEPTDELTDATSEWLIEAEMIEGPEVVEEVVEVVKEAVEETEAYTKEELTEMDIAELTEVAEEVGAKASKKKVIIIKNILAAQAVEEEEVAAPAAKPKRAPKKAKEEAPAPVAAQSKEELNELSKDELKAMIAELGIPMPKVPSVRLMASAIYKAQTGAPAPAAKKPAAKKAKTKRVSFEAVAVEMVEAGSTKAEIAEKFTELYEAKGQTDEDYIAKRVNIYVNIANKQLGTDVK